MDCTYLHLTDNSHLVVSNYTTVLCSFYNTAGSQKVPNIAGSQKVPMPIIGFFNPVIPTQNLVQSSNPKSYFWRSTSRAYFQSGMSSQLCFKISNPKLQMREIPYPEKRIKDAQHSTDSTAKRRGSLGMPICSSFW